MSDTPSAAAPIAPAAAPAKATAKTEPTLEDRVKAIEAKLSFLGNLFGWPFHPHHWGW